MIDCPYFMQDCSVWMDALPPQVQFTVAGDWDVWHKGAATHHCGWGLCMRRETDIVTLSALYIVPAENWATFIGFNRCSLHLAHSCDVCVTCPFATFTSFKSLHNYPIIRGAFLTRPTSNAALQPFLLPCLSLDHLSQPDTWLSFVVCFGRCNIPWT